MSTTVATDLISLVYTSTASQPFRETALEHLLAVCRRRNDGQGITGLLLHRDGRFIQVLEGHPDTVAELVDIIRSDSRHHDLRVLLEEPITERRFPDWTMGYRVLNHGESRPPGCRDSFADLDAGSDIDTTVRALTELTLWFRVRVRARDRAELPRGATGVVRRDDVSV